jgi:hypothetical protein
MQNTITWMLANTLFANPAGSHQVRTQTKWSIVMQGLNDGNVFVGASSIYGCTQQRKKIMDMYDIRLSFTKLLSDGMHGNMIRTASPCDSYPLDWFDLTI